MTENEKTKINELEWELRQAEIVATRTTPVRLVENAKEQAEEIATYWDKMEFDDRMSHYSQRDSDSDYG